MLLLDIIKLLVAEEIGIGLAAEDEDWSELSNLEVDALAFAPKEEEEGCGLTTIPSRERMD